MSQHDADRIRKGRSKYAQKCGIHILALCALRNNFHDRCANQNDKGKWHGNADPVERCTYLLLHSFYPNSNEELKILRARIRLFPVIATYSNFFVSIQDFGPFCPFVWCLIGFFLCLFSLAKLSWNFWLLQNVRCFQADKLLGKAPKIGLLLRTWLSAFPPQLHNAESWPNPSNLWGMANLRAWLAGYSGRRRKFLQILLNLIHLGLVLAC